MHDFQDELDGFAKDYNSRGIPEFEGYSPNDMVSFIHDPFGIESPIALNKLAKTEYAQIPLLNQVKYLMKLIDDEGVLNITKTGTLPTKVVKSIYEQGFIKDEMVELGLYKVYKESGCIAINLTRLLLEMTGLTKKRGGKLSLTKKGKTLLSQDQKLLTEILDKFAFKFNWGFYDGFESEQIGQFGLGFSLVLLSKYGDLKRSDQFYGEKYLTTFPMLLNDIGDPRFGTAIEYGVKGYSIRLFDRFLHYFGVVEIEKERLFGEKKKKIKTTPLFHKLISVTPPRTI